MRILHGLITLVLSALTPGLGHVYAGRSRQGVILWCVAWGGLAVLIATRFIQPPSLFLAYGGAAVLLACLVYWLVAALAVAGQTARSGRIAGKGGLRFLLALALLGGGVGLLLAIAGLVNKPVSPVWATSHIDTDLMQPALRRAEVVVAWRGYYDGRPVQAGDVVTVPRGQNKQLGRIIALPRDQVSFPEGHLAINGVAVRHVPAPDAGSVDSAATAGHRFIETLPSGASYPVLQRDADTVWSEMPMFEVPDGKYMLLLDNRLGPRPVGVFPVLVDRADPPEKILFIAFSRDFSRWGQAVR